MTKMCDVEDVVKITNKSKSTCYRIIRDLNKELKEKGFFTVHGRISERYLKERMNLI